MEATGRDVNEFVGDGIFKEAMYEPVEGADGPRREGTSTHARRAGEAAEFQRITGIVPTDIRAIREWQSKHGLVVDGKIGLATVEAASVAEMPAGTLVASAGPISLPSKRGASGESHAEATSAPASPTTGNTTKAAPAPNGSHHAAGARHPHAAHKDAAAAGAKPTQAAPQSGGDEADIAMSGMEAAPHAAPDSGEEFSGMGSVKRSKKHPDDITHQQYHNQWSGEDFQGLDARTTKTVHSGGGHEASAVYAVSVVEGGYDAVQTYDDGVLSFGILQWTLHQGSLQKFMTHLKTNAGSAAKAAFDEHFIANGIDVKDEILYLGNNPIKGIPELSKHFQQNEAEGRRYVDIFHKAGQDERIAKVEVDYAKAEMKELEGSGIERYDKYSRTKWKYEPKNKGHYGNPGP